MPAQVGLLDGFDPVETIKPCGGVPPGWAGPRNGRLSRLTGRVTNAHNAIEGEQVLAHERRGTVWRAA